MPSLSLEQFDGLLRIAGIIVCALLVSWIFAVCTQKLLEVIMRIHGMKERDMRVKTIGTVLRSTGYLVITLIAGVMVLQQLHIDATPIIASASVAGFAISFGAQQLIKDVFAGLFILTENQYSHGDVVKLDEVAGTVELLTLRKTVLVDEEGARYHVPHGQVRIVKVESRQKKKA
ncbi:MAG: mechanosensitive ion channel family protein [bacterium]|nr:mechanosensitive ion channel family protein [bacterium]